MGKKHLIRICSTQSSSARGFQAPLFLFLSTPLPPPPPPRLSQSVAIGTTAAAAAPVTAAIGNRASHGLPHLHAPHVCSSMHCRLTAHTHLHALHMCVLEYTAVLRRIQQHAALQRILYALQRNSLSTTLSVFSMHCRLAAHMQKCCAKTNVAQQAGSRQAARERCGARRIIQLRAM